MAHDHHKHVTPDEHDAPDQWHQHTPAEKPQKAHGEVANAPLILGVGLLMFVGLIVTVAIVYAYYTFYTTNLLKQQELVAIGRGIEQDSLEYKSKTINDFQGYNWVAEEPPVVPKDTVQIPLQIAKKKVASQYASQKN